jgi:uncharacterized Zn finger protein
MKRTHKRCHGKHTYEHIDDAGTTVMLQCTKCGKVTEKNLMDMTPEAHDLLVKLWEKESVRCQA